MLLCLLACTLYVLYMCLHMLLRNIVLVDVLIDDEHQILERHCLTWLNHTRAPEQDPGYKRYIN